MKRNNPKRNFSRYILGLIIGCSALVSCGTSQHITESTDGIYEDEAPKKRETIVVQEQNNPRNENSFTKELRRLEDLQQDEIITDIDNYHSDDYEVEVEPAQRTQINSREYDGWGASRDRRDSNVSISINTFPTWGYNRGFYNSWYGGVYDYDFYIPWGYRYGFDYGYYRPYWNTGHYGYYNRWYNRPYRYYRNPYYYGYRYNRPVYRSNPRRRGTAISRRGVSRRNSNVYRRPSTTRRSSDVYRRGTTTRRTRRTAPTRRSSTIQRRSSSNRTHSPSRRNSSTTRSRSYSSSRSSNRSSSPTRRSSSNRRR